MTRRDKAEIILACALLPPLLEVSSAARLLRWVRRVPRRGSPSPAPEDLARGVDRVLNAAPGVWHHTCLRRAVVLAALLKRGGREAEVVIGVRRASGGEFEAHAWLRSEGVEPYLEPGPVGSFSELRPAGS